MRYHGGKHLASRPIAAILADTDRARYLEPFVGGASVLAAIAPHFQTAVAADSSIDVILMWQAVTDGWTPPEDMSKEQYECLRHSPPSALRGFAGHACSFGGKWFAGYAAPSKPRPRVPYGENFARSGSRSCVKKAAAFSNVTWVVSDYRGWSPDQEWVVYCDPPYVRTTRHREQFDTDQFWMVMDQWSDRGAQVFVSEYEAPPGWACVWEKNTPRKMEGNRGLYQTERLWTK